MCGDDEAVILTNTKQYTYTRKTTHHVNTPETYWPRTEKIPVVFW